MEDEAEIELNTCPTKARQRLLRLNQDEDARKLGTVSAQETKKTSKVLRKRKPPASQLQAVPHSQKVPENTMDSTNSQPLVQEVELGAMDSGPVIVTTVVPPVSEVKEHLQYHISHTAEGKFRHGSILRPQFGKDNDRIINEYQQQEENQKVISSYREHFYRKQGDRLLQHARGEHASGQQGADVFNVFQNNNQDFRNKHLAQLKQVGNRYNKLLDDPMAKYGISSALLLADPTTTNTSRDKYGMRAKLEKFKAQNFCMDCRRLQFRVQNLEAQMAKYKMNEKNCQTLQSDQLETERLKKRVEALKIKRDPIAGLQAKVDRLERSQRRTGQNEETLCSLELELQRARECIERFRERNEWLENRVQVLAMQHTQQRNMIQVLGERSK